MWRNESAHEGLTRHICWEAFTGKSLKRPTGADACSLSSSWEEGMDLKGWGFFFFFFRAIAHELRGSRKQMGGYPLWGFGISTQQEQPAALWLTAQAVREHCADQSAKVVTAPENVSPSCVSREPKAYTHTGHLLSVPRVMWPFAELLLDISNLMYRYVKCIPTLMQRQIFAQVVATLL